MIHVAVLHTFLLVGSRGERTRLAVADVEEHDLAAVLDEAASSVASRLADPEEHAIVRTAAARAFERVETMPGTIAVAAERIPGDRLVRVFRHLAGEGPLD